MCVGRAGRGELLACRTHIGIVVLVGRWSVRC